MSHQVLARKHRPRTFEQMVGQEHVVQALANALTQQRLHHAYLFTGTRGVGKTTVSRILAKSLNCTGPDGAGDITAQPCGRCDACRDIDNGRFVDYIELDAASNRGVEEITQLLDQAVYKPVLGRFKVYMIDEVHMLSNTAFNAMLKTLEEPPDYLKFVLATTDPQKVPPTVLSRCLQFNLRPMAPQVVQEHLAALLATEGVDAEAGALRLLARAAHGSMRDALSLADQAIAFGAGRLAEAATREMLGAVDVGHAVRIVDALARGDGAGLVAAADALRTLGLSAAGVLEELATLLQQMAVAQVVPHAVDAADIDAATLQRLAASLPADELQVHFSIALHGRAELGLAPDEYAGLVMVLLRMLSFRPASATSSVHGAAAAVAVPLAVPQPAAAPGAGHAAAPASATAARPSASDTSAARAPSAAGAPSAPAVVAGHAAVSRAAPRTAAPATPKAQRTAGPPEEPPPWVDAPSWPEDDGDAAPAQAVPRELPRGESRQARSDASAASRFLPDALGEAWAHLVRQLIADGRINALARELAVQAQCLLVDDQAEPACWRLRVERENLRATAQVEKLQAALRAHLGRDVRIEIEPGVATDSVALRDAAERAHRQAQAEQIIHDDPVVKAMKAQFETARIVPGSVKAH